MSLPETAEPEPASFSGVWKLARMHDESPDYFDVVDYSLKVQANTANGVRRTDELPETVWNYEPGTPDISLSLPITSQTVDVWHFVMSDPEEPDAVHMGVEKETETDYFYLKAETSIQDAPVVKAKVLSHEDVIGEIQRTELQRVDQ